MARNILAVRVPLIAAINGDAIGIGATISLFCDVVYMADDARIADPHVRRRDRVRRRRGRALAAPHGTNRAKEYLMTGDLVSARRRRSPRPREPPGHAGPRGSRGRGDRRRRPTRDRRS